MSAIFLKILNLAISASWLIVAVIVVRLLLKKSPRWIFCLLWGLVAIRLICPFSLESALSLIPSSEVIPADIMMDQRPQIDSGMRVIDNAFNPVIEGSFAPNIENSVNPMQVVVYVASIVWIMGLVGMCLYAFASYVLLWRRVRVSVITHGNIRECDEVKSPFILGVFHPLIYVPSGMNSETLDLVIAHEEAHLKRKDHWWKPLGFALLSVYWFNPLCWVAYILLCRDIEAACDEKVIGDKDTEYMAAYSQALLDCSKHRRVIAACPLAFGETDVKGRVKGILNYKKPSFWIIIISIIICCIVAVCFITNPKKDDRASEAVGKPVPDLESPPVMTLTYGSFSTEVTKGAYNWRYIDGNGELIKEELCDAPTPLEMSMITTIQGMYDISELSLGFSWEPDSVSVKYWSDVYRNDASAYDTTFTKADYDAGTGVVSFPAGGGYIFEVTAVWENGTINYIFYILPSEVSELTFKSYIYADSGTVTDDPWKCFRISFYNDGTYTWSESLVSNYLGFGRYIIEDDIITLQDDPNACIKRVNRFRIDGDSLFYIDEGSDNFGLYKFEDGDELIIGYPTFSRLQPEYDSNASEVRIAEETSDEQESYYRVEAFLLATDFSVIAEPLSDMIEQAWDRWDNMTQEQRMLSSSIPGMVSFDCETWAECEETIGLTIYNPLEGFDWLDKVGYFGMDVSGISHVQTTANSSSDGRELNDITITSGYNSEEIRVTLTAVVSSGNGTYTVGSAYRGSARYDQKRVFSGTGIPVLVVITDGQNNLGYYNGVYYDPTAYWVRDNVFYTLRVAGDKSEEKDINEMLDRIISEI